jgi:hypothetical protein
MKKIILIIIIALIAIVMLAVATGVIAVSKDGKMTIAAGGGSGDTNDEVTRVTREVMNGKRSDESIRATRQAMTGRASDESIRATRQAMGEPSQQSPINPVVAIVGVGVTVIAARKLRKNQSWGG